MMRAQSTGCAVLLSLLIPLAVQAQGRGQITGTVTSDVGQPVAGVEVSVVGTQLNTVTGTNGRYVITDVPAGERTLRVTSVGYATLELPVTVTAGSPVLLNIQLETSVVALKEIVVTGYGTQRREEITGAVASVSSRDFIKGPTRDAAAAIAGKVPGLAVSQPSGDPRANSQIRLRGQTTIQGPTNPLILVDGVPGNLETVPAEDIESISVLKDGSAAAVYGSRASNGVILITTKRHAGGNPTLRYDGYVSQSTIYNAPEFLSASDYRRLIGEGRAFEDLGFGTDWQSEVLREPVSHRHNVTLSGGATNTNYNASLNYDNSQGIFNRSDNEEITGRANIRHAMFDGRLEAEANLLSRTQNFFTGPNFEYAWRQTLIRNPTDRVMDDDGNWQEQTGYFYVNPVALIEEQNGEAEERTQRLHGTLTLRPIDRLRFSLTGGTMRENFLSGSATTFRHSSNTQGNSGGTAGRNTRSDVERILEVTGTFNDRVGDHNFTLLGGYGYQDFLRETFSANNTRFPTDLFGWDQLQAGTGLANGEPGTGISSDKWDYKLIGFFGRLNYDWKNRYLLMASLRYEGNSRFGADHKWGTFPAVSVGWRLSEESFMAGLPFNDLRLRAGYGVTGIAPNNSYLSLTSYSYGRYFFNNGEWTRQLAPSRNPNPNLRWEEKDELNVGLNFSLFDFRLSGAVDVYRRDTKDLLFNYSVPQPPYLTGSILANVGTMRNSGVELELSYDVLNRPNVRWTTSANWSRNTNKLVTLSDETFQPQDDCFNTGGTGEPIQQSTHRICVGEPIGNYYGYKSVDIDDDGVWIVLSKDGERISIEDATAEDRHILGNGLPKQYFAWNNTAQIRNFDLSVNMRGAADYQILNYLRMYYENPKILQYNMLKSAFDPVYGKRPVNHDLSYVSYYIEDGDHLKLDNVTVGYTFGPGTLGRVSNVLSGARFYLSGRNLLTITGFKGMDPEVSDRQGNNQLAPGQELRDTYPTTRLFTAGVTLSF